MKWWIKFGCFLTGWNSSILSQCSEASFKHLKEIYCSLININYTMGIYWILFCRKVCRSSMVGDVLSHLLFFVVIVIQIERQIILTVGTHKWNTFFRFLLL